MILVLSSIVFIFIFFTNVWQPIRANLLAFKSYQLLVNQDFEESLSALSSATSQTLNNFGVNDILLSFHRTLEPDLATIPKPVLVKIADFFATKNLDIRADIKFIAIDIYSMTGQINVEQAQRDIQILNDLLLESPKRRALYYQLGQLYALLGDKEASISNFQKAIEIKKDATSIWNLATAYFYLKDEENFEKQARYLVDENYALGLEDLKLLVNYFENNKQDNLMLEKLFGKILEQDRSAQNLFDMAMIKIRLDKMDEAQVFADEAIKLDKSLEKRFRDILK